MTRLRTSQLKARTSTSSTSPRQEPSDDSARMLHIRLNELDEELTSQLNRLQNIIKVAHENAQYM